MPVQASRIGFTTLSVTLAWFFFNGCMSNINKWLFYQYNFKYPIFVTACHQLCCCICSGIAISTCPDQLNVKEKPPSVKVLGRVRVLAFVFAISIACGNVALRFVFPSFTQVVASTTPIWTSLAAYQIQGKTQSPKSLLCIMGMCCGCAIAFWGEVNFHVFGFGAIVCATALRGLKSVLGSILLTGEDSLDVLTLLYSFLSDLHWSMHELGNEVQLFPEEYHGYYTSQSATVFLFLASMVLEMVQMAADPILLHGGEDGMWITLAMSSFVAFFMNLCNFLVTFYTSAVTLSVLGNVKSVLVIMASLGIFRNQLSWLTALGTFITLCSAGVYTRGRMKLMVSKEKKPSLIGNV